MEENEEISGKLWVEIMLLLRFTGYVLRNL